MAVRLSACTHFMSGVRHEELQRLFTAAGFDAVEMSPTINAAWTVDKASRVGADYRAAGVPVETVHMPFGAGWPDVSDFYESRRQESVDVVKRAMETAAACGAVAGILHPGTKIGPVEPNGFERFLAQLASSLEDLLREAEQLDLRLALENMPSPTRDRFGSLPEHFRRFAQEFAHGHFCFCYDTGHALITAGHAGALELMDAMGDQLCAFHLSDTPGDRDLHLAPGHGLVDFAAVFARAAKLDPLAMCIEAPPFAPGPHTDADWRAMVNKVREISGSA